jgi:glycogen debranching enzyme
MNKLAANPLWNLAYDTIKQLETEQGILASSKEEIYGCVFGRDSLISCLKMLRAYRKKKDKYFLTLVRKILLNLCALQGKEFNIESGEEPGKCIHEHRPNNHEHLTAHLTDPWYVYPDNTMKNYDSVDSTPLFLIAAYRYYQVSKDSAFIEEIMPHIKLALEWVNNNVDKNDLGFVNYSFHKGRKFGGLKTQSWMDSVESVFFEEKEEQPVYPIAPVEAQAYTYLALTLWASYFKEEEYGAGLNERAVALKARFNDKFLVHDQKGFYLAFALDGKGRQLTSPRSSMGHCLWAASHRGVDGKTNSILEKKYVKDVVSRLLSDELFERRAGIRTLSKESRCYDPNSYHNGSIWPHDTSMVIEGLQNYGYIKEAKEVREAMLSAITHFKTPIELFVSHNQILCEYLSPQGQEACKKQAWSAASILKEALF